jgi:hypothetical protein
MGSVEADECCRAFALERHCCPEYANAVNFLK